MRHILDIGDHTKCRAVLERVAGGVDLTWFDDAVRAVAADWFRLGRRHLRTARVLRPNEWRSVVSRAYYAAYSVSRAIRYIATGRFSFESDDHKRAGDLPDDFPNRDHWAQVITALRADRNLADYNPWSDARRRLSTSPADSVSQARAFVNLAAAYLRARGVRV